MLAVVLVTFFSLCTSLTHALQPSQQVAIIGAGVGGSSTAFFLHGSHDASSLQIDVFEAGVVGGRAQDALFEGPKGQQVLVEIGASMIAGSNHYLRQLVNEVGLTVQDYGEDGADPDTLPMGIWDGSKFVVIMESSWMRLLWRAFGRYGVAPLMYGYSTKNMFSRFMSIYELQARNTSFHSPPDMLQAMQLWNETQKSCSDFIQELFSRHLLRPGSVAGQRFKDEFVAAVNRVNYNQHNAGMNALAGLVSFFPVVDKVPAWSVREGNGALAGRLIEHTGAALKNASVTHITRLKDGTYQLVAVDSQTGQEMEHGPFDALVIAAPLESANITFEGLPKPQLPKRSFQQTIASFVRGLLNPAYFGYSGATMPAGSVAVTDSAATPFTSISVKTKLDNGLRIYKLFSEQPLEQEVINAIFLNATLLTSHTWLAYPKFSPPEEFAPFVLAPGLLYGNAIENAASAMEMSVIAAKNSALLVAEHLRQCKQRTCNLSEASITLDSLDAAI